ncbi:MAG: flagellar motor protein MotA [Pseudomonadota bacterium]
MARDEAIQRLSPPRIYLVRMVIFLILTGFVAAILYPQVQQAFMANPGLNGLIVGVLFAGLIYAFRQVLRLFPEVNWVNSFRVAQSGDEVKKQPVLLAPMASILGGKQGRMVLSPMSLRSLLDSLASRLDESRDLVRYLIGLLIFLGLLGTFWGLLDTVSSVSTTIRSLDVTASESGVIFEDLKAGLEAPLQGMGTAFSSSLFGLAGSLILGFLELQAGQAQNRFYNDLEDWLSSVTDIEARDGVDPTVPNYLKLDLRDIQNRLDHVSDVLDEALVAEDDEDYETVPRRPARAAEEDNSVENLAGAVQGLVEQMREEQKVVREWAQSQADQQQEIHEVLNRLSRSSPVYEIDPPAPASDEQPDSEVDPATAGTHHKARS